MAELATLFALSFAAATLVPLPSEAALLAYVYIHPDRTVLEWLHSRLCVTFVSLFRGASRNAAALSEAPETGVRLWRGAR